MSESGHRPEGDEEQEREHQGPVVHDRRRIDPETGAVREQAAAPAPAAPAAGAGAGSADGVPAEPDATMDELADDVAAELTRQIAERTADLQRLQAEYANYRRAGRARPRGRPRARRSPTCSPSCSRCSTTSAGPATTASSRAAFKSVGEALEQTVAKLGLAAVRHGGRPVRPDGARGADPQGTPTDVTEATCVEVFQPGYRIGDRVVRPARVAVAEPRVNHR